MYLTLCAEGSDFIYVRVTEIVYPGPFTPPAVRDARLPEKFSQILLHVTHCHWLATITGKEPVRQARYSVSALIVKS